MFFSKDLTAREDALKEEMPDDIYIPYNSGRRIGMGIDTLNKRIGDFNPQPLPFEVSLKSWIQTKLGTGGFSGAKSTYLLPPKVYITSFGDDVTISRSTGNCVVTCPSTNRLEAVQITGDYNDLSVAGTFTISVNLGNATLNQGFSSMYAPTSFQVYDESNINNGGPSATHSFTVDNSVNTVQKEIIGVSGGVITLRVSNLQIYTNWKITLSF